MVRIGLINRIDGCALYRIVIPFRRITCEYQIARETIADIRREYQNEIFMPVFELTNIKSWFFPILLYRRLSLIRSLNWKFNPLLIVVARYEWQQRLILRLLGKHGLRLMVFSSTEEVQDWVYSSVAGRRSTAILVF